MSSEDEFRKLAELAPFAVVISSIETGLFRFVNQRFCNMLGTTAEELIGTKAKDYYANPEDRKVLVDLLMQDGHYYEQEVRLKRTGTNEIFWVSASGHLGEHNGEKAVFASLYDIDALKQTERQLRDKTEKLARSNAELEQFAYIASHDLQEPLRMIASYLQLLQTRYQRQFDKDADDFISFAVDGATRMQQMISDLLIFSRVQTRGKEPVNVSANMSLTHAMENLRTNIQEAKAKISYANLPMVSADPIQLTMLFQNVISNALKFHGHDPIQISVSAKQEDGMQEFCVADNGMGIDAENFERIFSIFQKLHSRVDYPGTGIGLAVCRRIVARHGGKMWVESQLGKGTKFYFTLPQAMDTANTEQNVAQAEII